MGVVFTGCLFIIISSVALLPTLEAIQECFMVEGCIAPAFTAVDEYGNVDTDIIYAYAQYLNDVNANGVLVGATTGEGPSLNLSENIRLLDAWIEATELLDLFVVVSVGGVDVPDTLALAAYAEEKGVSALFVLPPVYFRPRNAEDLAYYMQMVYEAAPNTPLVYDDIPQYTEVVVDIVKFYRLAEESIPTFMGVKSTSLENLVLLREIPRGQQKLYASDYFFLDAEVCLGIKNYILTELNYFPQLIMEIIKYGERGNMSRTLYYYQRLLDLVDIITARGNPLAAKKAAMSLITGVQVGPTLPPIRPLCLDQIADLKRNLENENVELAECRYD